MLKENIIFNGMSPDEIDQALSELCAIEKAYKKNSLILRAGDITDSLGLVLSGSATIESNDMWGNRTILSNVGEGGFFAETYALLENEPL
ncbi:MAG: cyclic nucleotide-binding domain-containing protein, partial [Lachnospiraceae bacterium]|nr:cyclic nucleotide-binding domain-containing protein [Lachnospiraceae bacterium]